MASESKVERGGNTERVTDFKLAKCLNTVVRSPVMPMSFTGRSPGDKLPPGSKLCKGISANGMEGVDGLDVESIASMNNLSGDVGVDREKTQCSSVLAQNRKSPASEPPEKVDPWAENCFDFMLCSMIFNNSRPALNTTSTTVPSIPLLEFTKRVLPPEAHGDKGSEPA